MPTNRCLQRFRPLSTWALCALELRDLNPADTSWAAFNYYIQHCFACSQAILGESVHEASLLLEIITLVCERQSDDSDALWMPMVPLPGSMHKQA